MFTNSQIDTDLLPKFEAVSLQKISSKYIYILLFNTLLTFTTIFSAVLVVKFTINEEFLQPYFWQVFSVMVIIFLFTVALIYLNFKTRKYGLREKDIIYSEGFITNKTTTLPFNRVQHLEISRSFLARKLGLSTLKIYSAGESGGDISINGLPKEVADKQYAFLIGILNERL